VITINYYAIGTSFNGSYEIQSGTSPANAVYLYIQQHGRKPRLVLTRSEYENAMKRVK